MIMVVVYSTVLWFCVMVGCSSYLAMSILYSYFQICVCTLKRAQSRAKTLVKKHEF